jgi:hypothetical protein
MDATTARWLGATGDALGLIGAVVLARDALMKYRDDLRLNNLKVTKSVVRLPLQYKKKKIEVAEDADRVFSVFTVWRAAWGCVLLVAGFGVQFVVRIWGP